MFKKTEDGTISCKSYGWHETKTGEALPVNKHPLFTEVRIEEVDI